MNMFELLQKEKFIALARHVAVADIGDVAQALYAGGLQILEITFDPSDPDTIPKTARAIELALKSGMIVGAGTVLGAEMVDAAHQAGAHFIVSPNTDELVIRRTKELELFSVPGAYTPTEIVRAHSLGANLVKIFPVLPHEVDYVKVVTSPLSHIRFMVTGGITPETIPAFLNAGATAVAAGASLIRSDLVSCKKWNEITHLAQQHRAAIESTVKKA